MSLFNQLTANKPGLTFSTAGVFGSDRSVANPLTKVRKVAGAWDTAVYSVAAGVVFFAIALSAFIYSLPTRKATANTTPAAPAAVVEAASGNTPSLEVHISNNGLVLLRGARVASIQGSTYVISTDWGSTSFTWTVHTTASSYGTHNFGTRFIDRAGNPININEIQIGTPVTVTGMLDNAKDPTLEADTFRSLK